MSKETIVIGENGAAVSICIEPDADVWGRVASIDAEPSEMWKAAGRASVGAAFTYVPPADPTAPVPGTAVVVPGV